MRATRLLAAVFVLAPAFAAAQQPCSSDAQSAADAIYRRVLEGANSSQADSFDSLDANRDGTLHRNEWRWSNRSFDQYDSDGDGLLTRREFNAGGGAPR